MKLTIDGVEDSKEGYKLTMDFDIGVGLGDVDPETMGDRDLHLLHTEIALPKLKLNEATYFLRLVKRYLNNEAATLYHFNSFVTALKSVLDVIVNQADNRRLASEWIKLKEADLMKDPDFNRIADLRNKSVHWGLQPPRLVFGVTFKEHLDGRRTLDRILKLQSVNGREIPDAIGTMERALESVRSVVADAEARGFVVARKKPGHSAQIDFQKEVEPGKWASARPQDMEMFGNRFPQIGFRQSIEPFGSDRDSLRPS